ncbi:hypothetical protein [Haliangium sp.]|uniref:hypothetical protein n=1 Tax=Haliangium sp. TaxID=2663208 RepID=UPI003D0AD192
MDKSRPSSPSSSQRGTEEREGRRVSPGKVTRASRLAPTTGGSVQRMEAAAAGGPRAAVKSAGEWTDDPWMDAAHRGVVGANCDAGVVQRQEAPDATPTPAEAEPDVAATQDGPDVDAVVAGLQFAAPTGVGAQGNTIDITALVTWTQNAEQRVAAAVTAYAALPADDADRARLATALTEACAQLDTLATAAANSLRTDLQALLNASSPVEETPAQDDEPAQAPEQPTLPAVADVDGLRTAAAGLSRAALDQTGVVTADANQTLGGAAGELADAALAIYQGRAVLSARADWLLGYRQDSLAGADAADRNQASSILRRRPGAQAGLNQVFADSGFNRYGVQAEGSTRSGWEPADWCGMFVVTHLFRASGLDGELRSGFLEVSNVHDFFNYAQVANASRVPLTVWVPEEGRWMDLRGYHGSRGSERQWTGRDAIGTEIQAGGAPFRSGDVCLINHSGGDTAQHIVMVDSYVAATGELRTIEGNTLGIRSTDQGTVERNDEGSFARDRGETSVGIHIREMNGDLGPDRPGDGAYQNRAGNTVLGRGRLSVVDFEDHRYATLPIASFPADAVTMSPAQMNQATQGQIQIEGERGRGPAAES